jgi:hypothetical protein
VVSVKEFLRRRMVGKTVEPANALPTGSITAQENEFILRSNPQLVFGEELPTDKARSKVIARLIHEFPFQPN